MTRVLLTGFEPFCGEVVNPSWMAVTRLSETWDGPADLVIQRLPVAFAASGPAVRRAVERSEPDVVIAVGEAGGRTQVTPELVGINWDDACIPDNAGAQPRQTRIEPDGPAARFTTLPVDEAVERMRAAGVPARVSTTAGTYVCNHVMYVLGGLAEASGGHLRSGFCHVPYAPQQVVDRDAPSLSTEVASAGLRILVETTVARIRRDALLRGRP